MASGEMSNSLDRRFFDFRVACHPRSSSKRPLAVPPPPPALVAVCRIKVRATRTIGTADDANEHVCLFHI